MVVKGLEESYRGLMEVISSYFSSRTASNLTGPITLSGGLTQTRVFHRQNTRVELYLLHNEIVRLCLYNCSDG